MSRLLYLAAPYTNPDPVENTHRVLRTATAIYEHTDYVPFVPHLNMLWHTVTPQSPDYWYEIDFHYLRNCHAIVRLPGHSPGADDEMAWAMAEENDIEIVEFESLPQIVRETYLGV